MPILGLGTYKLDPKKAEETVKVALEMDYRHIDTAEGYLNEEGIGKAIDSYDRSKLFITSKVLPSNLHYESVLKSCERSLEKLRTDYLDLYLVHWPNEAISIRETMQAMKRLYEEGRVKSIGVSNFSKYQLRIARRVSNIPISVNQIEFHPWLHQRGLLNYCRENDVAVTAAAPLGRTKVLSADSITELSEKYDKSPAQIVLRWEVQKKVATIPRSKSQIHIKENMEIFSWELESEDMERIDNIPKQERCYTIDLDSKIYGISP
ncbi:MAG: aldo/keto reductase [Candidatus Hadarchaeota archaeon]